MTALKKLVLAGTLILVGVALGLWIGKRHRSEVVLVAAPTRYVPSGKLQLVDSSKVEVAAVGFDLISDRGVPLQILFENGPSDIIGNYSEAHGAKILNLDAPGRSLGSLRYYSDPYRKPDSVLTSHSSHSSAEVEVPVKPSYKPERFSSEWLLSMLTSPKQSGSLQAVLPSEDVRLVRRDGRPFAVCGRTASGQPAIVLVNSEYVPQAKLTIHMLDGSLSFTVFNRDGNEAVRFSTDTAVGPQIYFSSEDSLSNTGEKLFPIDSTGTKLASLTNGNASGVVDWLKRPMYRPKLPLSLVDDEGRVIWSTEAEQGRR